MMANLLDRKWRTAERFLAQRAFGATCVALASAGPGRPANLIGGPRWTPVEEYGDRTKRYQGAPRQEQFLEISVGAF